MRDHLKPEYVLLVVLDELDHAVRMDMFRYESTCSPEEFMGFAEVSLVMRHFFGSSERLCRLLKWFDRGSVPAAEFDFDQKPLHRTLA